MAQRGSPARRQASVASRRVASKASTAANEVASTAKRQSKRVASTASQRGAAVAQSTVEDAKTVVGTAKTEAAQVAEEASAQARNLLEDAKSQLQEHAASQLQRLAESLGRLGEEALALREGRPEEAEVVAGYVSRAADTLFGAADVVYDMGDDIDARGLEGLVEDIQRFARRRPGVFLLSAALAGFGVGRAIRASKGDEQDVASGDRQSGAPGTRSATRAKASRAVPPGRRPARSRAASGAR